MNTVNFVCLTFINDVEGSALPLENTFYFICLWFLLSCYQIYKSLKPCSADYIVLKQ